MKDTMFDKFHIGFSTDSMERRRQLIVDYMCQAAAGPCFYTGSIMKVVHIGLRITLKEWDAMMNHLARALGKFKVRQKEKDEVLALSLVLKWILSKSLKNKGS